MKPLLIAILALFLGYKALFTRVELGPGVIDGFAVVLLLPHVAFSDGGKNASLTCGISKLHLPQHVDQPLGLEDPEPGTRG